MPSSLRLAVREVGLFPARLLGDLPAPTTVVCVAVDGARFVLTTSQAVHAAIARSYPTFTGRELAALALAAEHDRASAEALAGWCERKSSSPTWRLTADDAIGAIPGRFESRGWPIGRVLGWFGARVVAVEVGDVVPSEVKHVEV